MNSGTKTLEEEMSGVGVNAAKAGNGGGPADDVLLERFKTRREEAAFTALVQRHGPLVLGVCRQVLQHEQDAEDAFQAVFCVLARKVGTIRSGIALGGWLYTVAARIARKAKALQVRRRMRERQLPDVPAPDLPPEVLWRDLGAVLVEEVSRLPERYRQPFVLCELEGKSNQQAATELRCPVGTVCSRLARARERLRVRLTRRGLALSAGALAAAVASESSAAAIRTGLAEIATQTAIRYVIGQPIAVKVAALADAFLRAMVRARWTTAVGLASAVATIIAVVLLLGFRPRAVGPPGNTARSAQADQQRLQGSWRVVVRQKGGLPPEFPDLVYIFAGDHVTLSFGGLRGPAFPYTLDVSQNPSAIDFTLPIGKVLHGIYQLDEDSWKLCLDMNPGGPSKRPASMQPPPDAPYVCLFTFRREGALMPTPAFGARSLFLLRR
jgi:RNA polymerase sigma factor (sigma-70 family)